MSQYPPPNNPQPPYTQPGTYYPPQQQPPPGWQPGPPPPRPPKKSAKSLRFSLIVGAIITIALFACIGSALASHGSGNPTPAATASTQSLSQATSAPTASPTPTATPRPLKWTTVQKLAGNGNKKTALFTAPDDWKIIWTCQGFMDGTGIDGELDVTVYDNTNSPIDIGAVSSSCKAGGTSKGDTEEHQGGPVYLDIGATGNWTIQIQELK